MVGDFILPYFKEDKTKKCFLNSTRLCPKLKVIHIENLQSTSCSVLVKQKRCKVSGSKIALSNRFIPGRLLLE